MMPKSRRTNRSTLLQKVSRRGLAMLIGALALVVGVTGLSGYYWEHYHLDKPHDWTIPILKTAQIYVLEVGENDYTHPSNYLLMIARLCACVLFLVVSWTVIANVLEEVRRLPRQLLRRRHVILCGLGQIGLQLLDDLRAQGRAEETIVIDPRVDHPWFDYARNLGATVLVGDATRAETLLEARALQARELFIVTGDDGVNLEVAAELGNLFSQDQVRRAPEDKLLVYVHIVDTNLAATLRPFGEVLHDSSDMNVNVFNVPRAAAARLVAQHIWPHAPTKPDEVAHFVIVGFGDMGQALAIQLAQLGHFPNHKRCRMTIADRRVNELAGQFLARFPRFTAWSDYDAPGVHSFAPEADAWDWNEHPLPHLLRGSSPDAVQYACNTEFTELASGRGDQLFTHRLAEHFSQPGVKPVIFVCGRQDHDNFETAVQLRDQLLYLGISQVPIFVWLPHQPALAETLARAEDKRLRPFGECRTSASYQEITNPMRESLGRRIHASYVGTMPTGSRNEAARPWSELRDDFRESNRAAADHLIIKLAAVGFALRPGESAERLDADQLPEHLTWQLAEMEHNRWMAERLLAGWRYAPAPDSPEAVDRNKLRKQNHNLVAWTKLGDQRLRDLQQVRTALAECQLPGYAIHRIDSA